MCHYLVALNVTMIDAIVNVFITIENMKYNYD